MGQTETLIRLPEVGKTEYWERATVAMGGPWSCPACSKRRAVSLVYVPVSACRYCGAMYRVEFH